MSALLVTALKYATHLRWPVVPLHNWTGEACSCGASDCSSPAKHPRTRHGLKDASTDVHTIKTWWARWPDANIGLPTGSTFDVLDVDGEEGDRALAAAAKRAGVTDLSTDGPMASTGRGWHLLYATTGHGNRARVVEAVDWRGAGGYIVAPPSLHSSGRRYEWLPGLGPRTPLQPAPPWLTNLLSKPSAPSWRDQGGVTTSISDAYVTRAIEGEAGRVALAPEGQRNHTLNAAAYSLGTLVGAGRLDPAAAAAALLTAAQRSGLTQREAEGTIASGLRSGMANPRKLAA